jgi:glycosyltransferase involved in cell wall biosynthesis
MPVRSGHKSPALSRVAILGSRGFPSTYGGYETLVRYLARAWVAEGVEVTVYCRTRDEARRTWLAEGVKCKWTPGRDTKSLSTLSYGLTSHLDAMREKFDAALVLNVANGFYLPALRTAGIPTAVNTDGIEWERGKWGKGARGVFLAGAKATARFADVLIADSEAIGEIWQERFHVRSVFVPYGGPIVDEPGSDRIEALNLPKAGYALAVARLIPENNVELFLDALELTSPRVPAVVVGSANYPAPIEKRLKRLDHEGRLRWLGHVSDQALLTQLWANAGVYVHGHSVGGTNPALLQALGAGAPTVALDTVFNREVLRSEEYLFPADPQRLAERIRGVLDHVEVQERMRDRGREIVRSRYSWSDVCSRYFAALERAAAIRSAR